ncbi:MAG: protein-glutamate O-methyltransferase CheR [Alphaproteobacteria bacterium]|nr:protein-glutamate O-methyltransferase CheR [Alphaproteobacteria bacterium]
MAAGTDMQDTTFNEIADLALRQTGQAFKSSKAYLMEARLGAISRREGFATLDDLAHCLKARPNPRFETEIAAALTSKLTRFFGDRDLIERIVTHALPERLKQSTTGRLRVWCAGVATGQEPYSLAIRLSEMANTVLKGAEIEIVATDISTDCLETAKHGSYGHFEVQKGLSIGRLLNNFTREETGNWQINAPIREAVSFRRHNLIESAEALGRFDIIICRNVLSGMEPTMRARAARNLSQQLLPDALMFGAASESLTGLVEGLNPSRDVRGAYTRNRNDGAIAAA